MHVCMVYTYLARALLAKVAHARPVPAAMCVQTASAAWVQAEQFVLAVAVPKETTQAPFECTTITPPEASCRRHACRVVRLGTET